MFAKKGWILVLFVMFLAMVPAASATPPTAFDDGVWTFASATEDEVSFCFDAGDHMFGCGVQPRNPNGRAVFGVYTGMVGGVEDLVCEYTLARFTLPNGKAQPFSRYSITGCVDADGNHVGLHMVGEARNDGDGFYGSYDGRYHFEPPGS